MYEREQGYFVYSLVIECWSMFSYFLLKNIFFGLEKIEIKFILIGRHFSQKRNSENFRNLRCLGNIIKLVQGHNVGGLKYEAANIGEVNNVSNLKMSKIRKEEITVSKFKSKTFSQNFSSSTTNYVGLA